MIAIKSPVEFVINKGKDIITNIIVLPFRYILESYGIVHALCFLICVIGICCTALLYVNNKAINDKVISNEEIETIQKLAYNGNADAQKKLGDMYFFGTGLNQDYQKAFTCYMQSAEQGNADAQYQLGLIYYEGKGVSINYHNAYLYYALSYINGNGSAYLDGMYDIKRKKLLSTTEIIDITEEAQNIAKRIVKSK